MRIILSRKGLDSGVCDISNLLFVGKNGNKNLIMLPIPADDGVHTYQELNFGNEETFNIVKQYLDKSKKINIQSKCHADPNIVNYFNDPVFLGSIGQVDQAQSHLQNQKIDIGDLFIFFGVFAEAGLNVDNNLVYNKSNLKHIMFGYMQIGDIIPTYGLSEIERANYESKYPWLKHQPHWIADKYDNNKSNCIYVASEKFNHTNIKGYGIFNYDKELQLTQDNNLCVTYWNLPQELSSLKITYHSEKSYKEGYFKAACRGQEFVIEDSKQAEIWSENLIKKYARR